MVNRMITPILILALMASGYMGVRAFTKNPCSVPKTWSLGSIDPRFGLSHQMVESYASEAAEIWNAAYEANPLLAYAEKDGDITISFIYDERQETTNSNEQLKEIIEEEKEDLNGLKRTIESLRAEYGELEQSIRSRTAAYNAKLTKHNKEVTSWNQKGGAPNDVYQRLQREASALETERAYINQQIGRHNKLADTIRTYGTEHNEIVGTINEKISALNETAMRDFEEGTYDPNTKTITIYEYGSISALKRVLIHEFGHALSLPHVEDKEAFMYPINQGKTLRLAEADKEALLDECRERTVNDVLQTAKLIRDDIARLVGWSSSDTAVQAE